MKKKELSNKKQLKEIEKVIKYFKNQTELARVLGLTRQYIRMWKEGLHPVSYLYAMKIEILSKGKFNALDLISQEDREYLKGLK